MLTHDSIERAFRVTFMHIQKEPFTIIQQDEERSANRNDLWVAGLGQ